MKRSELQKCCICLSGVMNNRQITFSRVTIERFAVDVEAVQRRDGLENMFGGGTTGAALAQVMGTDEDLAKKFGETVLFVCDSCGAMRPVSVLELSEHEPQRC